MVDPKSLKTLKVMLAVFIAFIGISITYAIAGSSLYPSASVMPVANYSTTASGLQPGAMRLPSSITSTISTTTMPQSGVIQVSDTFDTNVEVGSGSLSASQSPQQSTTPLIHNVLSYNINNAQWLITCPLPPNPLNTLEYFQNAPNTGGDQCLTGQPLLSTTMTLNVYYAWSQDSQAESQVSVTFQNPGTLTLNNYAYSGASLEAQSGQYNISNGYDSQSYIFNNVNASNQGGLWNWINEYATLSNAKVPLTESKTFSNPIYDEGQSYSTSNTMASNTVITTVTNSWSWTCTYPYTYTESAAVESVQNANVPMPLFAGATADTFVAYNGINLPTTPVSHEFPSYRFSIGSCSFTNLQNMYNGCHNIDGWKGPIKVSGTQLFIQGVNWNQQTCFGYSGYTGDVYVNDSNPNELGLVYGAVCPLGSIGWHEFLLNSFDAPNYFSSQIVPYFFYNYSMPALISNENYLTEYLNMSYDLYSPHNYLNPAGNLEPFNLSTGSGLLANYNGNLTIFPFNTVSLSNPQPASLTDGSNFFMSTVSQSNPNLPPSLNLAIGAYTGGRVVNASFIAISPNDYIYVTNYSPTGGFAQLSGGVSYLYSMRFVPSGYFNLTNYQPNSVGPIEQQYNHRPTPADYNALYSEWNSTWKTYWDNAVSQQGSDIYITNTQKLSQSSYQCFLFWCWNGNIASGVSFQNFRPTAITTDYSGDVFALGLRVTGGLITPQTKDELFAMYANGIVEGSVINPGFLASDELAVTPSGKYLFIGNASSGNILIYEAPQFTEVGVIDLSYSNSTYNLNIASYLANGGPFGNSALSPAYTGMTVNDISSNHHPVGMTEYEGMLYVLDNWTFSTPNGPSSILMLRAYNGNGTEIPVDSFKYNDMIPVNTVQTSGAFNGIYITYPPYGWPLSANISLPSAHGGLINYCSSSVLCTTPSASESNGYPPIGPFITSLGPLTDSIGLASDFNGDLYLLAHANNSKIILTGGTRFTQPHTTVVPTNLYTELLAFRMNIQNYTQTSLGAYSPYVCYLNGSKYSSGSPYCTELSGDTGNVLNKLYPPLVGIPDSFNFSESNGGPTYFNYPTLSSTYFPTGIPADPPYEPTLSIDQNPTYPGDTVNVILTANSQVSGDPLQLTISNSIWSTSQSGSGSVTYTENTLGVGNYNVQGCDTAKDSCAANQMLSVLPQFTLPSGISPVTVPYSSEATYLNSHIGGYVLMPYNITYSLSQNWDISGSYWNQTQPTCETTTTTTEMLGADGSIVSTTSNSVTSCNGISPPTGCTSLSWPPSKAYYAEYATLPLPAASANLIYTIQGGGTYPEYLSGSYYQPNVSDAKLIVPPTLLYNIFTNRIFGDVYVNQSVNSIGAYSEPLVLNANLNGEYTTEKFTQTYGQSLCIKGQYECIGASPAYEIQVYTPIAPVTGTSASSAYFGKYATVSQTQPPFTYSIAPIPSTVQLFNIFRFASYVNALNLNMTSQNPLGSNSLGYNRLIFTYVDQFNNTITMPLDVDLAQTTSISMDVTPTVNAINPNETAITVTGSVGTVNSIINPTLQPLAGVPIYLYYNANLNFYDANVIPYATIPSSVNDYLDYGDSCAFSSSSQGCSLANYLSPVNTFIQTKETNFIDFHTQYNSINECAPEPKSLLQTGNFVQCNINPGNAWNLPQSGLTGTGNYEFCVPVYSNGTGYLTSQLGLAGIATTASNGVFSYTFNTCGTGNDRVIASYFGWPPPEPITVYQPSLSDSLQFGCASGNCQNYQEYNYYLAPANASQTVNIGLYELSFGNVGTLSLLAFTAAVALLMLYMYRRASW